MLNLAFWADQDVSMYRGSQCKFKTPCLELDAPHLIPTKGGVIDRVVFFCEEFPFSVKSKIEKL